MSDEVGVSMTGRALRNLSGEAGDRAGPRLPPRVQNLASLKKGWKQITNDPYVLSIAAKGYRLHFTSPPRTYSRYEKLQEGGIQL